MNIADFYHVETNSRILRISNKKPLNKYFWEKEKAEAQERLAKQLREAAAARLESELAAKKSK